MNTIDDRIPGRKTAASLLLLGWCAAAGAADADQRAEANASCRQETKRVAVWPHGSPKAPVMARFEQRQVTVCDPKVSQQVAKGK